MTTSITSGKHLSSDELFRYRNQQMSPAEMHRIEKHLLDCKLCDEALQGIDGGISDRHFHDIMRDLKKKNRRRYYPLTKKFSPVEITTLFALVFLIGMLLIIGWYLILHGGKIG